ncbi:MAG: 50S ribosomal protein L17 [Endomicrobiaceae bacterium]|jgi:large subunit ribosomal protein L17|nr:50S ribosomal protein L17 [Endomicrobiaceae bacterium]
MIKNHNTRKLAVTPSHKRAMMRNMTTSLFLHEKITTTVPRAKEVVRFAEKLITKAKPADLDAKRVLHGEIANKDVVKKVFDVLVPRYKERNGGYTQVFKLGLRKGDSAEMAVVKLVI